MDKLTKALPLDTQLRAGSRPASAAPVPATVRVAYWLFITLAALFVVTSAIGVQNATWAQAIAGREAVAVIQVSLLILVILISAACLIGVPVFFSRFLIRGRNWARIVLTIYSAVIIGTSMNISVLNVVAATICAVGTVPIWVPSSNAYFRLDRRPAPKN
jgi:hypothetical protein